MALKRKITKAEHTALNVALQAEYKAEGDDFVLDAEGFEDPGELRRAKDREVANAKVANARADKAEADLQAVRDAAARNTGDVATLEKSWKDKLDKQVADNKIELEKRDKHLQTTLVDGVALRIATELAGDNALVILPHIKQRLQADLTGESPLTRVLDKDGRLSAMSPEELQKEFKADARFKSVIIASKASGGGAAGGTGAGGGAVVVPGGKKFNELTLQERIDWNKADPKGFEDASKANQLVARETPRVQQVF